MLNLSVNLLYLITETVVVPLGVAGFEADQKEYSEELSGVSPIKSILAELPVYKLPLRVEAVTVVEPEIIIFVARVLVSNISSPEEL
jgi:hypothetical protein